MTRFDDNTQTTQENNNFNNCDNVPNTADYQEHPSESVLENANNATPSGITSFQPSLTHIREEESDRTPEKTSNKTPSEPLIPESVHAISVSSSDLNVSNFPLKERNFLPKLRESTSFDPREPIVPKNLVLSDNNNGKENKNSQTDMIEDNTIQCNEVSSSNIDIDNLCNEDEEAETASIKSERHNLRSTKKAKSGDVIKESQEEEKVKVSVDFLY